MKKESIVIALSIIICMCVINFPIVVVTDGFAVLLKNGDEVFSEDVTELKKVYLRMSSNGLTPIQPSEDTSTRKKSVPNGYEHTFIPQTVYTKVGEWTAPLFSDR